MSDEHTAQTPECFCGRTFRTWPGLDRHQRQVGCSKRPRAEGATLPSIARHLQARATEEAEQQEQHKQERANDARSTRRKKVLMKLAAFRFIKLVAGTTVDDFKAMHKECNDDSNEMIGSFARELLGAYVPPSVLDDLLTGIRERLDTYEGIRTEKQELSQLKFEIPQMDWIERSLPNTAGSAFDFKLDQCLLLLVEHNPALLGQLFETFVEWQVKGPHTRDDPKKILVDIPDGIVFQDHPIFGQSARVSREQVMATLKTACLRWCLLLYADAFTVVQQGFPKHTHTAHPTRPTRNARVVCTPTVQAHA